MCNFIGLFLALKVFQIFLVFGDLDPSTSTSQMCYGTPLSWSLSDVKYHCYCIRGKNIYCHLDL